MPSVQDARRQTQFLLSGDLAVFEQTMNLQLQIVAANAKLRTVEGAAILGFWSRTFCHLADACTLMTLGSYASCAPLLRAAYDCVAAQRSLLRDGFGEYEEWFAGAIGQAREHGALSIDLGRFRAGSALVEDKRLGSVYRLLTELSMPHFGTTAIQTAPDSNLQKLAIGFADSTFHLGWAELISGWLLMLADVQLTLVISSGVFSTDHAALAVYQAVSREVEAALANRRHCYVEEVGGRFLFSNWRRAASGAPKRIVL